MTVDRQSLGAFGALATAIGLLDSTGQANQAWFGDPVGAAGGSGNQHGLRHLLADDGQRTALVGFVDEILGPPAAANRDGQTWVPLFTQDDPSLTISAVVAEDAGIVRLGIGLEHASGSALPRVACRLHVPLFQFVRRGGSGVRPSGGGLPDWLVLGRPEGRVGVSVDVIFTDVTPTPGTASLGGIGLSVAIPTASGAGLDIELALRDLQLPGARAPRTFALSAANLSDADDLSGLGRDVFDLLIGVIREQANAIDAGNPALRPFAALTGVLGLRDVPGLPPLPFADLTTRGIAAIVGWAEAVLTDNAARDAWLGQLATLVDGTVDTAADAVAWTAGPVRVAVGLRVSPGAGGHPVLVPTVEVALATREGAWARLAADLLRADTGTGTVVALPCARLEGVFGADAGGGRLLAGGGDTPSIGSLHTGLSIDGTGRPGFLLTLHDVGVLGRNHPLLDVSTPSAALDAASEVLEDALIAAIAQLGPPGVLLNRLLGLDPPTGVDRISVPALLADPLAELTRYWRDLTGSAAAGADVLGRLRALMVGGVPAPVAGAGTPALPWRLPLAANSGSGPAVVDIELRLWREGPVLIADLAGTVGTPVLDNLQVRALLAITVLRLDLAQPTATFGAQVRGRLSVSGVDGTTATLALGPLVLAAQDLGVECGWSPAQGLRVGLVATGLTAAAPDLGVQSATVALPTWDETGGLRLPDADWTVLERILSVLLGELRAPAVSALLDLAGWRGQGPHLALAGLLGADPLTALNSWLADLVFDADRVRMLLGPVATVLSGWTRTAPRGLGTTERPLRCPVGEDIGAPGLTVWLEPEPVPRLAALRLGPIAGPEPPEPGDIAGTLAEAATQLPDIADLLVARDSLEVGLAQLCQQWTGTDGVVGAPASPPAGVVVLELEGRTYDELVALGSAGLLVDEVLTGPPAATIHIGCEPSWVTDREDGTFFDLSAAGATDAPAPPASLPGSTPGTWFVRLPTPAAAAAARPDRGGVGEQAARLAGLLAGRTAPVVLVGYGAAGAATVRAAGSIGAVSDVVTVGTPWSADPLPAPSDVAADALALLRRLNPPGEPLPDTILALHANPCQRAELVLGRTAADLPSAGAESRREGLGLHAVFGHLDEETLLLGLGQAVAAGIQTRLTDGPPGDSGRPADPLTAINAALDAPMARLDLGGLLVAIDTTLRLCRLEQGSGRLTVDTTRSTVVEVRIGVRDGWLVGGPGDAGEAHLRWLFARVEVSPDGPGSTLLVLHEAGALGIDRERWEIRANAAELSTAHTTTMVPEARILLAAVAARLRAASSTMVTLLDLLGLSRDGGLDPDGTDLLLHQPAPMLRGRVAADPVAFAAAVRAVIAGGGLAPDVAATGSLVRWRLDSAPGPDPAVATPDPVDVTVGIDVASGTWQAMLSVDVAGLPAVALQLSTSEPDSASVSLAIGTLDPHAGGLRLAAMTGPARVAVQWQPQGSAVREVALLPEPDGPGLTDLVTIVLPAMIAQALATALRALASPDGRSILDAALDAVGLLGPPDHFGSRSVVVPLGLLTEPGGWLRNATQALRDNTAAGVVALLRPLGAVLAPGQDTTSSWPLAPGVSVVYRVESTNRLRLAIDVELTSTVDTAIVVTRLGGGLVMAADAPPRPFLQASLDLGGRGLLLAVDSGVDPPVALSLVRPAPAPPLVLYPGGPGLGEILSDVAQALVPLVLNAVASHGSDDSASLVHDVGRMVYDLGLAMDLMESGSFSGARVAAFAADPAAALLARLPYLLTTAVATVARALDRDAAMVGVTTMPSSVALGFGRTRPAGRPVSVVLDTGGPAPAVGLRLDVTVPGLDRLRADLRASAAGVDVSLGLGPVSLEVGAVRLRPLLVLRAGSAAESRMVGVGLALDDVATRSVQVRWTLDADPPGLFAVHSGPSGDTLGTADQAGQWLAGIGLSIAGGLAMDRLRPVLGPTTVASLSGVVLTEDGSTVDPGVALDLFEPDAVDRLAGRLRRLLWNAAGSGVSVTLGGVVTIGLARFRSAETDPWALGVNLSVTPGARFPLAQGDVRVDLEVDASWVHPTLPPGLSVLVLSGRTPATLTIVPAVAVVGIGVRFSKSGGPLLSLGGLSLDSIAVHVYGEAGVSGVGGGVNLELAGFAVSPGGAGGDNAIANGIMNDAGQSAPSSRPSFSPALAIQKHPGADLSVSLRAGPPPGPWWLVVQRQLGPLYLERIGIDTAETAGTVSRVALYFDGRVSLFGFTAAVDQLSIGWDAGRGDVLDIGSWAVDLQGLAISADLSGASLAGGLLKTTDAGVISYVGMLVGRFGTYGLSVFGGYSQDANGDPSFFVFGSLNGPIGGPPAFFVTGVGGGLGINRGLNLPADPASVGDFVFVRGLDPSAPPITDPMDYLRQLGQEFPVQHATFWFAAGISFNSFTLVDGVAVLAVSFGDGLDISILGLARMALPRPGAELVNIELALLARFSTREGVFMIQAQLTDNSWLLYRDVRITGGFAFAVWWKGPLAGQFVLSIGGYHPDFHRDGYPEVPRLGLVWQVSDAIVIKGGAYFALTSEALMAGVDVEISVDFGFVWARIAFGAHGIVYFDPFFFEVYAYARISAGVKLDVGLFTISLSLSLAAEIRVWGPDFAGEAALEVGPVSLSVAFGGPAERRSPPLPWVDFVTKYLEAASSGTARALSSIAGRGALPPATGGDRAAPTANGTADRPFEVFAEFELTVVSTVPMSAVALPGGDLTLPVVRSDGLPTGLGIKPMQVGLSASLLRLRLQRRAVKGGWVRGDDPADLALLTANLRPADGSPPKPTGTRVETEGFPIGAWGAPEPAGLPAAPLPTGDVVYAGSRLRLVAEARLDFAGPTIDYYQVVADRRPLPLQANGTARADIVGAAAGVALPEVDSAEVAFAAAEALLFPDGTTRSPLGRVTYRRDAAAPPLFGTLADGMRPDNPPPAPPAAATAPALAPLLRDLRGPTVVALLPAGSVLATRPARTTVADGRIRRVSAPSVTLVQSHLVGLPISLVTAALPAVAHGDLIVAAVPRTVVPGAARSVVRAGQGAVPGATPRSLGAGDVLVLALPDATVDVGVIRPALTVDGSARVVLVRGAGVVVHDGPAHGGLQIPRGTSLVWVQAGAARVRLAGWHATSRVSAVGSSVAVAPGCVLTTHGRAPAAGAGWVSAGDLLRGADAVSTRFAVPVQAIAVVVEAPQPSSLAGIGVVCTGGHLALDRRGRPLPPRVLVNGASAVLVYAVVPDPGAGVVVSVRADGPGWRLAGVLGSTSDAAALAAATARDGVVSPVRQLTVEPGPGCLLSWTAPPAPAQPGPVAKNRKRRWWHRGG